jgi:hypothetical protein
VHSTRAIAVGLVDSFVHSPNALDVATRAPAMGWLGGSRVYTAARCWRGTSRWLARLIVGVRTLPSCGIAHCS